MRRTSGQLKSVMTGFVLIFSAMLVSAQFAIPARPVSPGRQPVPVPTTTKPADSSLPGLNSNPAPTGIPQQSLTVHAHRNLNLDTALAKLLEGMKDFMALGDMEILSNDPKNPERHSFVISVNMLDGRIRTELDLRRIRADFDTTNPFSTFRQIGIHRIVSITLPRQLMTHVMYPSVGAYLSKPLPAADLPGTIRVEKRMVGREQIGGQTLDKYQVFLGYPTGDRQLVELWESTSQRGQPAFVKFDQGNTFISIRFSAFKPGKPPAELFTVPGEYVKYADQGVLLQTVSAKFAKSKIIRPTVVPQSR